MSFDHSRRVQGRLRHALLATSFLCATALMPAVAAAQEAPAQAAAEPAPDIVVTGSRLIRPDLTAPSPITVVNQDAIKLSGNVSLEKTLNEYPQLASGNTSTVNNGGSSGVLTANLRGLGATRTLTLVNGRRFIPADSNGSVDLASIPDALIKRVEVITGGASAVYGSDAIAGAVNFILDDNFRGLEATAQAGITDRGDAGSKKFDLTYGAGLDGGRGNVTFSASWATQDPITQADRPFGKVPLAEINGKLVYSGSGNIPGTRVPLSQAQRNSLVGVNLTPTGTCTSITGIRFGAGGTPLPYCQPEDTYNYAPFNLLQRPQERINLSALAHYDFTDHITAYTEAFFVNSRNNSRLAPDSFTPVTPGAPSSTLLVPNYATSASLSPAVRDFFVNNRKIFDPDGDGTAAVVGGGRRANELGTRDSFYERQSYEITTGLRGDFDIGSQNWRWDAFYQYMRNRTDTRSEGVINQTRLSLGLDSILNAQGQVVCRSGVPGCVPVSIFGLNSITPEAGKYLTPTRNSHDIFQRQVAGASLSGALFDLPAGPVAVAAGVEYRKDQYESVPSAMDLNNEYGAASNNALAGSFDVKEVFGELRIPILKDKPFFNTLAIEGAARYSDYSTIGGVFTWKLGGEYAPIDWIRFRGAYNRAIRAPNINELFSARGQGFTGGTDPCARPNLTGTDTRSAALQQFCVAQGVPAADIATFTQATLGLTQETGGNPNLHEEKSKTYTIGAVVSPPFIPRLNLTADYFDVEVAGAITTINAQQTLNDCYTTLNANSPTCKSIFRLSSGQIDFVRTSQNNIGALKVRGLDVQADYRVPLPGAVEIGGEPANLSLQAVGSWLFERSTQVLSSVPAQDCAGFYGAGCSTGTGGFIIPDFKLNLSAIYSSGPLTVRGQGRMIGGLNVYPTLLDKTIVKSAPSVWYFDLTANVDLSKNFTFFAGVNNLFDKMPPILGTTFVGDANVDVSLYDTLGRRYFAGLRMKF